MNHIIVDFQPFMEMQRVLVYIDGECVHNYQVSADNVVSVVGKLKNEYNIHQIDLCGNRNYLSRFQAQMNTNFANDTNCNIEIIER